MTAAQKTFIEVQKRQSTLRGEFNTLRTIETRSSEQDGRLTALDGELSDSETEFRVKGGVKLDHGGGGKPDHPAAGRSF